MQIVPVITGISLEKVDVMQHSVWNRQSDRDKWLETFFEVARNKAMKKTVLVWFGENYTVIHYTS